MVESQPSKLVADILAWMKSGGGRAYACVRDDYFRPPEEGCTGCIMRAVLRELEAPAAETSENRLRAENAQLRAVLHRLADEPCGICDRIAKDALNRLPAEKTSTAQSNSAPTANPTELASLPRGSSAAGAVSQNDNKDQS